MTRAAVVGWHFTSCPCRLNRRSSRQCGSRSLHLRARWMACHGICAHSPGRYSTGTIVDAEVAVGGMMAGGGVGSIAGLLRAATSCIAEGSWCGGGHAKALVVATAAAEAGAMIGPAAGGAGGGVSAIAAAGAVVVPAVGGADGAPVVAAAFRAAALGMIRVFRQLPVAGARRRGGGGGGVSKEAHLACVSASDRCRMRPFSGMVWPYGIDTRIAGRATKIAGVGAVVVVGGGVGGGVGGTLAGPGSSSRIRISNSWSKASISAGWLVSFLRNVQMILKPIGHVA